MSFLFSKICDLEWEIPKKKMIHSGEYILKKKVMCALKFKIKETKAKKSKKFSIS